MSAQEQSERKPSAKAKVLSARLLAVQALYQHQQNNKPIDSLINEYMHHRTGMEIDGESMVEPDGVLLKKIINGVHDEHEKLSDIIAANINKPKKEPEENDENRDLEPLLKAILLCATYELLAHQDIDFPVIINDYINVTHAFYDKMEAGLVNGVLDPIARQLRS